MQERAKEIILRAKKNVFTGNLGNHLTSFKGDGIDFAEIRDYNFGDDVRKINWKATAKSGELKLNEFNEERELHIVVACMISGGLNFGTNRLKQDVMAELVALLGFSAIANSDRFELILYSNRVERHFKPTKSSGIVEAGVEEVLSINPIGKKADYRSFVNYIQSRLKKRAVVIILGDFLEENIDLSSLIRHQLYAIKIRDHFEEELNLLQGDIRLINPTNLESMEVTINKSVIKDYQKELLAHDTRLKEHFLEYRVISSTIYTIDDLYLRAVQIFKG